MNKLKENGCYDVGGTMLEQLGGLFWSDYAGDRETLDNIKATYDRYGYLVDTHTAVGICVCEKYRQATGDPTPTVVLSTASPYKFNGSVVKALLGEAAVKGKDEFELLETLSRLSGTAIPVNLRGLDKKPVLHPGVVNREDMAAVVRRFLLI